MQCKNIKAIKGQKGKYQMKAYILPYTCNLEDILIKIICNNLQNQF